MTLDKIHSYLNFIINKEQGKWYTPPELDDLLYVGGSIPVFNTFYQMYVKTQSVHDALSPFRKKYVFGASDFANNVLTCPNDYIYPTNITNTIYNNALQKPIHNAVVLYKEDEWNDAINSQVVVPTQSKPVAMIAEKQKIEFFPGGTYNGVLRYLRMPVKSVFGYTLDSRGKPVYNSGTSTQLEWADPYVPLVVIKTLSSIGINMGEEDITNWAEGKANMSITTPNKI